MNSRARPGQAYIPTHCEHLANTVTHGVGRPAVFRSSSNDFWKLCPCSDTCCPSMHGKHPEIILIILESYGICHAVALPFHAWVIIWLVMYLIQCDQKMLMVNPAHVRMYKWCYFQNQRFRIGKMLHADLSAVLPYDERTVCSHKVQKREGPVSVLVLYCSSQLLVVPSVVGLIWMLQLSVTGSQCFTAFVYGGATILLFTTSTTFHMISYTGTCRSAGYICTLLIETWTLFLYSVLKLGRLEWGPTTIASVVILQQQLKELLPHWRQGCDIHLHCCIIHTMVSDCRPLAEWGFALKIWKKDWMSGCIHLSK